MSPNAQKDDVFLAWKLLFQPWKWKISINQLTPLDKLSNGASQRQSAVFKILDRREAIKKALSSAEKRDIVLILGKGTEQTMVIGSEKIPWDDREVAREEIKNLTKI